MVTRTQGAGAAPRRTIWWRSGRARPAAAVLSVVLLAALLLGAGARPAAAQTSTLYFLTLKRGFTYGGNGEDLFNKLEAAHGAKKGGRAVETNSVELDIYGVSGAHTGLGVGVEMLGYNHAWVLADGLKVHMSAKGVLFTFKTFLRLGSFYPFFGFGLGNYYVNYDETPTGPSLRDSPDTVYNMRVGMRILFGRLGLLLEAGQTRARLPILTDVGKATLELGGPYSNAGLFWVF